MFSIGTVTTLDDWKVILASFGAFKFLSRQLPLIIIDSRPAYRCIDVENELVFDVMKVFILTGTAEVLTLLTPLPFFDFELEGARDFLIAFLLGQKFTHFFGETYP